MISVKKTYAFNEGMLELPAEWQDKTIHVLTSAKDDTAGLSFTISRAEKAWGMTFGEYADSEMNSISKQLTGYQHINKTESILIKKQIVENEFEWNSTQGHIHQLMTFIDIHPLVLIFTASMTGQLSSGQKEKIRQIIQTFSLRVSD